MNIRFFFYFVSGKPIHREYQLCFWFRGIVEREWSRPQNISVLSVFWTSYTVTAIPRFALFYMESSIKEAINKVAEINDDLKQADLLT